jgi:hypothetical protein
MNVRIFLVRYLQVSLLSMWIVLNLTCAILARDFERAAFVEIFYGNDNFLTNMKIAIFAWITKTTFIYKLDFPQTTFAKQQIHSTIVDVINKCRLYDK